MASAAEVTEKIIEATSKVETSLSKYGIFYIFHYAVALLNFLEKQIYIPKTTIVIAAGLAAFTTIYILLGPAVLCNFVGFVYPVYVSFMAIETTRKEDDTQWLTYWVVYATFTVIESFVQVILFWFPFYYSAKFGFLVWMFMPQSRGALFLYKRFVRPIFLEASSQIESNIYLREVQPATVIEKET